MMTWAIRLLLVLAGSIAAVFVARDAGNFSVVQGMVAVALIAAVVVLVAVTRRK
jgi:hypothetical protein